MVIIYDSNGNEISTRALFHNEIFRWHIWLDWKGFSDYIGGGRMQVEVDKKSVKFSFVF